MGSCCDISALNEGCPLVPPKVLLTRFYKYASFSENNSTTSSFLKAPLRSDKILQDDEVLIKLLFVTRLYRKKLATS